MNRPGNNFATFYYASGLYRQDYEEVLAPELPSVDYVDDSWTNYEKLKSRITFRYIEWRKLKSLLQSVTEEEAYTPYSE